MWLLKLVHGSIKDRDQLSLSIEKIAKLEIGLRRATEAIMLAVMAGCGAFLFALMSAKDLDENLIFTVGLIGCAAGLSCFVSAIITVVVKEQNRKNSQSQLDAATEEEPVDGCSWGYVAVSFCVTTCYTVLMVIYVIVVGDWPTIVGRMILPMVMTCMVVAVVLRPKDEGAGIKILHLQFFLFAFGSEGAAAVGDFQRRKAAGGWFGLLRLVIFWPTTYILLFKLRRKAARLPPPALSNFLCNTILLQSLGRAMVPMIFFTFEALSCVASNGFETDQCDNTSYAALCLSVFLVIITIVSIASKAVSREVRGEGLTYENLAILRLKKRQKIQGSLVLITVMASMYLFSVLGVKGDPNESVFVTGGSGAITLGLAVLIEMFTLVKRSGTEEPTGTSSGLGDFKSEKRLSLGKIEDDMTIAGLV